MCFLEKFMSNLTNFVFDTENGSAHAIRSLVMNGEPWFVASDVCEALSLETHVAVRRLDDDEKDRYSIPTLGGQQEMTIINESGLYSLILTSRKPQAKKFKKWVTSDVLPAIRKTGMYVGSGAAFAPQQAGPVQFLSHSADILVAADRTFRGALRSAKSAGIPLHRALRQANDVCMARTGVDMLTELDAHDQLNPANNPRANAPSYVQNQINRFVAEVFEASPPLFTVPLLSVQLYRAYTWWCRQQKVIPLAHVKLSAHLVEMGICRIVRKRYLNAAGESVGPISIAMHATQAPPPDTYEPEWIGAAIATAHETLQRINA